MWNHVTNHVTININTNTVLLYRPLTLRPGPMCWNVGMAGGAEPLHTRREITTKKTYPGKCHAYMNELCTLVRPGKAHWKNGSLRKRRSMSKRPCGWRRANEVLSEGFYVHKTHTYIHVYTNIHSSTSTKPHPVCVWRNQLTLCACACTCTCSEINSNWVCGLRSLRKLTYNCISTRTCMRTL